MTQSRAGALLALQVEDDHVATLSRQVAAVEADLTGDPEVDRRRAELAGARQAGRAAEAQVAAVELELMELRGHADAIERRLFDGSVRNPQELMTLQRELDGMRAKQVPLEDTVLDRMEHAETLTLEEAAIAEDLGTLEEARAAAAGPGAAHLAELRDRLAAAALEREGLATAIAPADLELYRRLAVRVHPAVVALNNDACGGCRLPLGIQEARRVRANGELTQCSNCDRIVAP